MKFTSQDLLAPQRPSHQSLVDFADGDENLVNQSVVSADASERLGVPSDAIFDTYDETVKKAGYTGDAKNQAKQAEDRKRTGLSRRERRAKRYEIPFKAEDVSIVAPQARSPREQRKLDAQPTAEERSVYSFKNMFSAGGASTGSAGWNALAGTIDIIGEGMGFMIPAPEEKRRELVRAGLTGGKITAGMRDIAASSDEAFNVPAEFRKTTLGKFIAGGASIIPAIPTFGMSSFGQIYTESINDSEQSTGLKLEEMSDDARTQAKQKAMVVGIVGGAAEFLGAKALGLTKMFKGGTMPKNKIVKALKGGASEVGTETFQGQLMDTTAVAIEGDDRQLFGKEMFDRRLEEAVMALVIGTGVKAGTMPLEAQAERSEIESYIDASIARDQGTQYETDGRLDPRFQQEPTLFGSGGNLDANVITAIADLKEAEKGKDQEKIAEAQAALERAVKENSYAPTVGQSADMTISKNLLKALDPIDGATEVDWNYVRENFTDEQLVRHMNEITTDSNIIATALLAKNGNEQAQKDYVEEMTVDKSQDLPEAAKLTPEERADREREAAGIPYEEIEVDPISFDQSEAAQDEYGSTLDEMLDPTEQRGYDAGVEARALDQAVADTIEFQEERLIDGSTLEWNYDTLNSLQDKIDERIAGGESVEEAELWGQLKMDAAAATGVDISGGASSLLIRGVNMPSYEAGVHRDVSRIFKGAKPFTVYEETAHGYLSRMLNEGTLKYGDVAVWANQVEGIDNASEWSEDQLMEWAGAQSVAWAQGKTSKQTKLEELPKSVRDYIGMVLNRVMDVMRRAAKLKGMSRRGELPKGFEQFLERSIGADAEYLASRQGQPIAAGDTAQQTADENYSLEAVDANRAVAETVYLRNSQKFQDKLKSGAIRPNTPIGNFNGKEVYFHAPDFAMAGTASVEGEQYVESTGGVYYPVVFSDGVNFWASTRKAAEQMARDLNKNGEKNGGKILMGLVTSPAEKMFSSTTISRASVDFFNVIAKNPKKYGIKKADLNRLIVNASKAARDKDKAFPSKLKKSDNLSANVKGIKEMLNPDDSTFPLRKSFVENLAAEVSEFMKTQSIESNTALAGALLGSDNLFAKRDIRKGKLAKASVMQGLGEQLSESFTKDLYDMGGEVNKKMVYAVIEYDGRVEPIFTGDQHESYPYAIRGIDGGEVVVNVLDRAHKLQDIVQYSEDVEFKKKGKVDSTAKAGESVSDTDMDRVMPPSAGITMKPLRVVKPRAGSVSTALPSYSLEAAEPETQERQLLDEEVEYIRLKQSLTVGEDSTDQAVTESEETLNFMEAELSEADPEDRPRLRKEVARQREVVKTAQGRAKLKTSQEEKTALKAAFTRAKIARIKQDAREKQAEVTDSWKAKLANTVAKRTKELKEKAGKDAESVTEALKELEMLQAQLPRDIQGRLGGWSNLANRKTDAGRKSFLLERSEMMMRLMSQYAVQSHRRSLRKTLKPYASKAKSADRKLAEKVGKERRNILRVANYYAGWEEGDSEMAKPKDMEDADFEATKGTFAGVLKTEKDPVRIYEASEAAKSIVSEGRFERKEFIEARKEERKRLQKEAIEKTLRSDTRKTENERNYDEQQRGIGSKLWQMQGDFMSGLTETTELMMRRLDGSKDGFFRKEFFSGANGVSRSALRYKRMMADDAGEYLSRLQENVFRGQSEADVVNKLASWGTAVDSGIYFSVEGGKPSSQKLSIQQAVTLRLLLKDRTLDSTFKARHNIDEENRAVVMAQIENFIGTDGVAYSETLAELYSEYGVEVGATFKSLEGYDLDLVSNYSPVKRAAFGDDTDASKNPFESMVETNAGATSKGGALKSRVDTTAEFRFLPADVLFGEHLNFKNRYIAFAPLEQKLRDTFFGKDGQLRGAIEQKHGKDFSKRLYKTFDSVIAGRLEGDSSMLTKTLSYFRGAVATSVLMVKPKITATQLGSIPAYIDEMPAGQWFKYSAKFYKDWYKNMNTLLQTDFLKDRMTNSQNEEILYTMNRQRSLFPNANQWRENGVNKLMFNVKFGDIGAIIIGGWPVYQYTYDQAIKRGATEAEAAAEAEVAFTEASAVQQSTELHTRSHFYRTSELARTLLLFRTSPLLYHGKVQASLREAQEAYVNSRDGKISGDEALEIAKASAKSIMIFQVVLPQIYYMIAGGFVGFWHDDDDVRATYWKGAAATLVLGNLSAVPIAGGIAAYATGASAFSPTAEEAGGSALIDASMALTSVDWADIEFDDLMGEDNSKAIRAVSKMIDVTTGYGSKTLYNTIEGVIMAVDEMSPEAVFQILGWSKYTFK